MDQHFKNSIAGRLKSQYISTFSEERQQFIIREFANNQIEADSLNGLKQKVKNYLPGLYPKLISLLSPVSGNNLPKKLIRDLPTNNFAVNMGSGTHSFNNTVNVDGFGYSNVHIVADLQELPFEDNTIDTILSVAVLEHVLNPEKHVSEFLRTLKPGGKVIAFVPFLQPFHASPYDYQRYTDVGLRQLFSDFSNVTVCVSAGPTSALLWTLQEWLAIVFSFGSMKLYQILIPIMWILSPLKILDLILSRHPAARISASGFYIECTKPIL